jgi:hypothetical protein
MTTDNGMRLAMAPAISATAANGAGADDKVLTLQERVRKTVLEYFPKYRETGLTDPPHAEAFHRGLLQLPLRQPKPGDSTADRNEAIAENRRMVYKFTDEFGVGAEKAVYKKVIDRAMALVRAREEMLEGVSGRDPKEIATLATALNAAFTAVYGMDAMVKTTFLQAMMLEDEEFKIDDEW